MPMDGNSDKSLIMPGERADDLEYKGLRIIQSPASFCFGTDSIVLTHFAFEGMKKAKRASRALDMGAGSGVIALLLNARTGIPFTAAEIDPDQCGRLRRTLVLNGIGEERISVINADYLDRAAVNDRFDYAVCNPPYFGKNAGTVSKNGGATHELTADIASIAEAAARLLRFGGKLFICCPAERLSEALCALTRAGLEPKLLRLVQTRPGAKPYLALIRANRGAKSGMIVEKTLVIYGENGSYTEEVEEYYRGE